MYFYIVEKKWIATFYEESWWLIANNFYFPQFISSLDWKKIPSWENFYQVQKYRSIPCYPLYKGTVKAFPQFSGTSSFFSAALFTTASLLYPQEIYQCISGYLILAHFVGICVRIRFGQISVGSSDNFKRNLVHRISISGIWNFGLSWRIDYIRLQK